MADFGIDAFRDRGINGRAHGRGQDSGDRRPYKTLGRPPTASHLNVNTDLSVLRLDHRLRGREPATSMERILNREIDFERGSNT